MAAPEPVKDLQLLKKTKISVFVDEILPDILVVTYEFGVQLFKGVLLDSTKRNLPCGIQTINPAFSVKSKNPDDDPLYTVNQRFAYMDPNAPKKKNVQMGTKFKSNKMTVRLRPRQVLCSKCKGICNENSENISRKRKNEDTLVSSAPKRSLNAPITRSVNHLNNKRSLRGKEPTLVPRLTRLNFVEEETIVKNQQTDTDKAQDRVKPQNTPEPEKPKTLNVSPEVTYTEEIPNLKTDKPSTVSILRSKRILRKKRSISTEITTEDTNQQDNTNRNQVPQPMQNSDTQNSYNLSTRTIKISYGPQGEGTVLKIPAQIDSLNDDSEENVNNEEQNNKPKIMDNKAARRALKKAKKEARRKVLLGGSPLYLGGASPRYTIGSASPRQGLGNGSPRYMCSTYDINLPRRRKHKVKHKKKHKEEKDRKHKEGEVSSTQDESKEQYITQKLSINLKRLNNSYTQPASSDNHEDMSSSDEHSETVPDFPSPSNPPVMLRINTHTVPSSLGADGIRLLVGDVVWGKVHGFPWWPGKILTITTCGAQVPQAHVAWYGSSTSSVMQCDQLSHYLDNFKIYYNKKKKGPYKEAIKQATNDARENAENRVRQPLGNSPSHNIIQIIPPALASPREIDVLS
ncbi:PWWP domain-containing protein 2A-like [Diorhabda carinulata]|uniref:PWWP domain-containing protein 2A-like n=1 Tax=Diorhabda carinulata TaxID=1163345 RepID=UPI0025A25AC0|nr:PWWP domain-containing protein 2A-like [Diorhabda carinulata]